MALVIVDSAATSSPEMAFTLPITPFDFAGHPPGQVLDLGRDHGKAMSCFAGAARPDGGNERRQT
jgi:hypothetical protein